MNRPARVYRLDITYPEGSQAPGWYPPVWDAYVADPATPRRVRKELRAMIKDGGFKWPKNRLWLACSAAYRRANLLTSWGATVEVRASDPVYWPAQPRTRGPRAGQSLTVQVARLLEVDPGRITVTGCDDGTRTITITAGYRADPREERP